MGRLRNILLLMIVMVPVIARAQNPSIYDISRVSFSENAFSDIAPVIVKDGVMFCSDRRFSALKDRTSYDGRRLYNIYIAQKLDSSHWSRPKLLNSERIRQFNNGPLSVAPDGKTIYFTSEVETGKAAGKRKFRNKNGIFIAELSGTQLSAIKPFKYNSIDYEVGHPCVSQDGKYLYFASDMPGGSGKSDLYYCENINGEWSKPVNLGTRINSPGVENFPFIHSSGQLYFSSDRPGGKGKLDVYSTSKYNDAWDDPVFMADPINSPSDDFAFVADDNLQTGYFSSNRSFDDDIFSFSSTIIRKSTCDELIENSYCFRFFEENAIKYDSIPFIFRWDFGDGGRAEGSVVEHCFPGPGKYLVRLDVVNLVTKEVINNQKVDTLLIEDEIQPYISSPDNAAIGHIIKFDSRQTNLPGWQIAQYYWNFGDQTIAVGEIVDKKYDRPGTYNVQLILTSTPGPDGSTRQECVSKNIIILTEP